MKKMNDTDMISAERFSFTYPGEQIRALEDICFEAPKGSFLLVAGPSGSGKTTLLRSLKKELRPVGRSEGVIHVPDGVAYVMQDPANQIVMDVVWHELAFGLENLGFTPQVIERRIAETAHFFGIASWIHRSVSELSGGEKQILNLASSLILNPEVLILDEPTAQLDPIAVQHFLSLVQRIHREVGTTLIMSEHRMTDVLAMVDDVLFLEQGRVSFSGTPEAFACHLLEQNSPYQAALPAATLAACRADDILGKVHERPALAIPEARRRLQPFKDIITKERQDDKSANANSMILESKHVQYRYRADLPTVLDDASLVIRKGSIHTVVGGNGSGKSTLLYLLSGVLSPLRGRVVREEKARIGLMTQHAKALFTADTLFDDLMELSGLGEYSETEVMTIAVKLSLTSLLARHPYDLSGGEMQKAALAKLLLLSPDILLLDEPVKGLDAVSKREIAALFRGLQEEGKTLFIATHDLNFSALVSDTCSLIFDGRIVATGDVKTFYRGNAFYTTDYVRVTEGIIPGIVTADDLDEYFVNVDGRQSDGF
ncbi:MAG TPA: ATP-binding cassette domain-containing protein [Clostridia bacterium]|nr:ATP-binding cassette domain-containing protein [Clostridia bacterium]